MNPHTQIYVDRDTLWSSEEGDPSIKPDEYLALVPLGTRIAASQDAGLCHAWQRRPDGRCNEAPVRIEGRDQMIQVPGLGIAIPLAGVYRGSDV